MRHVYPRLDTATAPVLASPVRDSTPPSSSLTRITLNESFGVSRSLSNETMKPRFWIVTELFYPDQTSTSFIVSKIADKMMEKYDVNVITDASLYQENKFSADSKFQINNKIKIFRVKTKKRDKNDLKQRTKKLISVSAKLARILWKNVRKGEKVFIVTNPAPLLVVLSWIKKIKKFELYILVHDVFPENTLPSGIIKSDKTFSYKIISSIFNNAYSSANKLIVLGRDMKDVVERKISPVQGRNRPSVHIIENWADIDNIKPSNDTPKLLYERHGKGLVTIQYAGNIGRLQGLEGFLQGFSTSTNRRLCFDLWGDGAVKVSLSHWVNEQALDDRVLFHGSYARGDQNIILNSTDIALVTLSDGMYGLGVPSKTYNILAAGKPILFIGDLHSEIALLVKEEDIGFCFSPNDREGFISFLDNLSIASLPLLEEKGKKARSVAEDRFSEERILSRFLEIL